MTHDDLGTRDAIFRRPDISFLCDVGFYWFVPRKFVDPSSTHPMEDMDERKVEDLAVSDGICACTGDHVLERVEEFQSCDWILHFRGVLASVMVPSTFAGVLAQIIVEISHSL